MNGKSFPIFPQPTAIEPFCPDEAELPDWLKPAAVAAGRAPRVAVASDLLRILAVAAALSIGAVVLGAALAVLTSGGAP